MFRRAFIKFTLYIYFQMKFNVVDLATFCYFPIENSLQHLLTIVDACMENFILLCFKFQCKL